MGSFGDVLVSRIKGDIDSLNMCLLREVGVMYPCALTDIEYSALDFRTHFIHKYLRCGE